MGAYVQIIDAGTDPKVDSGMVANVNYTGRTLVDNIMFDSNTDPAKGHVEPLPVNLTDDPSLGNNVIEGWKEGIKMLGKGGKAIYGVRASNGVIVIVTKKGLAGKPVINFTGFAILVSDDLCKVYFLKAVFLISLIVFLH